MSRTSPENNTRYLEVLSLYQQALEDRENPIPESIARGSHWAITATLAGITSLEQLQKSIIDHYGETSMSLTHQNLDKPIIITLGSLGVSLGADSSPSAFTLPQANGAILRLELNTDGNPNYQIEAC